MDSKTFRIVDFSISGTLERRPDLIANSAAFDMLMQCCRAIDHIAESDDYDIRTSVSDGEDGSCSCSIELVSTSCGNRVCCVTVDRLFILAGKAK